jgi:hypothetical protein
MSLNFDANRKLNNNNPENPQILDILILTNSHRKIISNNPANPKILDILILTIKY